MAVVIDGMLVNYGIFIKRFIHIKKVFIYQFYRIYYIGILTIVYLKSIQPNLIKKKNI